MGNPGIASGICILWIKPGECDFERDKKMCTLDRILISNVKLEETFDFRHRIRQVCVEICDISKVYKFVSLNTANAIHTHCT